MDNVYRLYSKGEQKFYPSSCVITDINIVVEKLSNELLNYFRNNWNYDIPTLIMHSSGFDSRIMSLCLLRLQNEGMDLGKIHFRCGYPEHEPFIKIMKAQNWPTGSYSIDNELPLVDHWDVGRFNDKVYGWATYKHQLNFWRDIVPYSEEKKYQVVFGIGGGEMWSYPISLKYYYGTTKGPTKYSDNDVINRWLNYFPPKEYLGEFQLNYQNRFKNLLTPFLYLPYLSVCASTPLSLPNRLSYTDNVREGIIKFLSPPDICQDMLQIPYMGHNYRWDDFISEKRRSYIQQTWNDSKFHKSFPNIPFSEEAWGFATYYETL